MKLDTKVKTLGPVNYEPLKAAACNARPDLWYSDKLRQQSFDVHAQTQSIILLFTEGWPEMNVEQRQGWSLYSNIAAPVMRQIIKRHYSIHGTVIRAMFAKLIAGGVIEEHMDKHPSFSVAHRIHVPLMTNDDVDFIIDDEIFHLKEGMAYEVSNLDFHSVKNRSNVDRVHFIFDYVPDDAS